MKSHNKGSIDQRDVSEFIWNNLSSLRKEKDITLDQIATWIWKAFSYLTNALNWRITANTDFFWEIAKYLWMSERKFDELVKEANKYAFEKKFGPIEKDFNTLEDIDFEIALSREFNDNEKAIKEVKQIIEFVKSKYWNKN